MTRWSLFLLISVGRGNLLQPLFRENGERLMGSIYDRAPAAPFIVATTEAPSYRRVALERMRAARLTGEQIRRSNTFRSFRICDRAQHCVRFAYRGDLPGGLPAG